MCGVVPILKQNKLVVEGEHLVPASYGCGVYV
jgi:hypothetical protein